MQDLLEHNLQIRDVNFRIVCVKGKIVDIYNRFSNTQNFNSRLWSYILHDLKRWKIEGLTLPSQEEIEFLKLGGEKAGDLLLRGLSRLADYDDQVGGNDGLIDENAMKNINQAGENLRLAIEKGAICAAFLATKMLFSHNSDPLEDVLEELSMITADKGNYQALEEFLEETSDPSDWASMLYQKYGKSHPPMDVAWAEESETEAMGFLDRAIKGYGSHVPADVWFVGAQITSESKNWMEANSYIDRAFTAYGKDVPFKAWEKRAEIKEKCGDLQEAIYSLNQILSSCHLYQGQIAYRVGKEIDLIVIPIQINRITDNLFRLQGMLSLKNT